LQNPGSIGISSQIKQSVQSSRSCLTDEELAYVAAWTSFDKIHQAILLAPALSPLYPLATALDRTDQGIDVFYSNLDCVVLGAGTYTVGTIDRVRTPASGMVGFRLPLNADYVALSLYGTKLHQHGYDPAMSLTGHFGGHLTCTLPEFVNRYVSTVLR
jgi:hypothetical protein